MQGLTLSLSSAWTRMRVEVKMIVSFIFLYTNKMQDYSHNGRISLLTHKGKITNTHTMAGRITHTMAGLLTRWQDYSQCTQRNGRIAHTITALTTFCYPLAGDILLSARSFRELTVFRALGRLRRPSSMLATGGGGAGLDHGRACKQVMKWVR